MSYSIGMLYAKVAIPKALPRPLIYLVPEGLCDRLKAGHRVCVPLHRRQSVGFVIEIKISPPPHPLPQGEGEIFFKEIAEILDETPVFSQEMIELISWMASYYCAPIGEVCRAALPPRLSQIKGPKLTRPLAPPETMVAPSQDERLKLNDDQRQALDTIVSQLKGNVPLTPNPLPRGERGKNLRPILLHGITGSGKTEVYLRAFEEIKKMGRQGLLLIPEISLTPQLVMRFKERFADNVAVYHSGLTEAQRQEQWEKMRKGDVFAAVGTRSALFAPFGKLAAIIVDEEHDGSYKQDEGLLYHARDCAVMRAKLEGALVVLGSATPSVESFANARSGKYIYCHLPERATGADLPEVEIVDMRENAPQKRGSLANATVKAIEVALERKEQVLLFLNRRGFANFLLCQSCGHVFECPNCDIALTQHRRPHPLPHPPPSRGREQQTIPSPLVGEGQGEGKLLCHYCDYQISAPDTCPTCNGINLMPMGRGTQKVEEELAALFPKAKIARLDRDTSSKALSRKTFLSKMQKGEIDILVGTQLIAKGHDFPNVTLVGVIDADVALHLPDFRSFERTFQLLTQVAGRAGRANKPGRVIIQTYQPDHPSIVYARDHDYASFFEKEHEYRKALRYPPFARVANIRFSGNSMQATEKAAQTALIILKERRRTCKLEKEIDLLGPAPAPLQKIRGKFRYQLLIKAPNAATLSTILNNSMNQINESIPSGCRMAVDVDPMNML